MFMEGHDRPTLDEASVSEFNVEDFPALGFPTSPINGSRGMFEAEELVNGFLATRCGIWKARNLRGCADAVLEGQSSVLEIHRPRRQAVEIDLEGLWRANGTMLQVSLAAGRPEPGPRTGTASPVSHCNLYLQYLQCSRCKRTALSVAVVVVENSIT